jgi:hypothetical protein
MIMCVSKGKLEDAMFLKGPYTLSDVEREMYEYLEVLSVCYLGTDVLLPNDSMFVDTGGHGHLPSHCCIVTQPLSGKYIASSAASSKKIAWKYDSKEPSFILTYYGKEKQRNKGHQEGG